MPSDSLLIMWWVALKFENAIKQLFILDVEFSRPRIESALTVIANYQNNNNNNKKSSSSFSILFWFIV